MNKSNKFQINAEAMLKKLPAEFEVVLLDSCSSTSTILLDQKLAKKYFTDSHKPIKVLITKHQNAGRGRYQNQWLDNGNSILFSISWQNSHVVNLPLWSTLVWGILIVEKLTKYGFKNIKIKWPNDLYYLQNKKFLKLGGILFERKKNLAVLGLGINVISISSETNLTNVNKFKTPPISLLEINPTKKNINYSRLISDLIINLDIGFNQLITEKVSFKSYYPRWQKLDVLAGNAIPKLKIYNHNQNIQGNYLGINEQGGLLLSVDNKIQNFYSGRVEIC